MKTLAQRILLPFGFQMDVAADPHSPGEGIPKVVLDTNVFVAAGFQPKSASAAILAAVLRGDLQMVWNEATRRETEFILGKIPPLRNFDYKDCFRGENRFTGPVDAGEFLSIPDPGDRKFAALAKAAGAILVSNDGHLLRHSGDAGPRVVKPGRFSF